MLSHSRASEIARIASTELGRGSAALAAPVLSDLFYAAESLLNYGNETVAGICTGFYIPRAQPPAAETDGPLGAVQIALAIATLGGKAIVITDSLCAPIVRSFISAGLASMEAPFSERIQLLVSDTVAEAPRELTHAISIERPGRTQDGTYRNMRGTDISRDTAPLDLWFDTSSAFRIAIGDGGNEAGMGRIPPEIIETAVPLGSTVRSVVGCDRLIVGGTSNWAAFALCAAIALGARRSLTSTPHLSEDWSFTTLTAAVEQGAVDGVTASSQVSVDGLEWPEYWRVPASINTRLATWLGGSIE